MKTIYMWLAQDGEGGCYSYQKKPVMYDNTSLWVAAREDTVKPTFLGNNILTKKDLERQPILCKLKKVSRDNDV